MPASVAAHRDPRHTLEDGPSTDWSLAARVWVDAGELQEVGHRWPGRRWAFTILSPDDYQPRHAQWPQPTVNPLLDCERH